MLLNQYIKIMSLQHKGYSIIMEMVEVEHSVYYEEENQHMPEYYTELHIQLIERDGLNGARPLVMYITHSDYATLMYHVAEDKKVGGWSNEASYVNTLLNQERQRLANITKANKAGYVLGDTDDLPF